MAEPTRFYSIGDPEPISELLGVSEKQADIIEIILAGGKARLEQEWDQDYVNETLYGCELAIGETNERGGFVYGWPDGICYARRRDFNLPTVIFDPSADEHGEINGFYFCSVKDYVAQNPKRYLNFEEEVKEGVYG